MWLTLSLPRLPHCHSENEKKKAAHLKLHEHIKRFLSKCTASKVDLLQDYQIYCLQARMCALFGPEI